MYLLARPGRGDPRRDRPVVVVSRQSSIDSRYNSVIGAPIHTRSHGESSQVLVGEECGLKYPSAIHCDGLINVQKPLLTNYIGSLPKDRIDALDQSLAIALGIDHLFDGV